MLIENPYSFSYWNRNKLILIWWLAIDSVHVLASIPKGGGGGGDLKTVSKLPAATWWSVVQPCCMSAMSSRSNLASGPSCERRISFRPLSARNVCRRRKSISICNTAVFVQTLFPATISQEGLHRGYVGCGERC